MAVEIERKKLSDLRLARHNANQGTEAGQRILEDSLQQFGAGRSILIDKNGEVIAGNHTLDTYAQIMDNDEVIVIRTDGKTLVAVQRDDLAADDERGIGLAIADNRASEVGLSWDRETLDALMERIETPDVKQATGFNIADYVKSDADDSPANECPSCGHTW